MDSVSIFDVYRPGDWRAMLAVAGLGVAYALLLQCWMRRYPESFADNTYLQVVGGVGYVVIASAFVLDLAAWLRVCGLFAAACPPIIARSLLNAARRRRETNGYLEHDE
jgi:formate-dependent nitrite reductase membrane component NrfD